MMSTNVLFCPIGYPDPHFLKITITYDQEKMQILTLEKLESGYKRHVFSLSPLAVYDQIVINTPLLYFPLYVLAVEIYLNVIPAN